MKTYVEVACTIYKTALVEVEHERDTSEAEVLDIAMTVARDEYSADDVEIVGIDYTKPTKNNMAKYDDFLEVNE
jgi:ribosomal protein S7